VKIPSAHPLRLLVAVDEDSGSEDIAREFISRGFEVRVTSDRREILARARDRSADLFLLRAPAASAEMLLLGEKLQSLHPDLAGRILFLPECSPGSLGDMVGKLAPVMQFLSRASDRFGPAAGRVSPEASA
jgi:hypothetical protein